MNNKETLVFKGAMFEVYQWQQKMFDAKYKLFEKVKRKSTVNVIPVTTNKEILIGKQTQPGRPEFIGCFGGMVEDNESMEQAAKRELLEETGYSSSELRLWFEFKLGSKIEWPNYTYIALNSEYTEEQHLDNGEKIVVEKVSFDEFIELTKDPRWRDIEIQLQLYKMQFNPNWKDELKALFSIK